VLGLVVMPSPELVLPLNLDLHTVWRFAPALAERQRSGPTKNSGDGNGIEDATTTGLHTSIVQYRADLTMGFALAVEGPNQT